MALSKKKDKKTKFQDFPIFTENKRGEIIEGVQYDISHTPGTKHQKVQAIWQSGPHLADSSSCEIHSLFQAHAPRHPLFAGSDPNMFLFPFLRCIHLYSSRRCDRRGRI